MSLPQLLLSDISFPFWLRRWARGEAGGAERREAHTCGDKEEVKESKKENKKEPTMVRLLRLLLLEVSLTMLCMCSQILLNLLMLPEMRVKVMACRESWGDSAVETADRSTCIRTCRGRCRGRRGDWGRGKCAGAGEGAGKGKLQVQVHGEVQLNMDVLDGGQLQLEVQG